MDPPYDSEDEENLKEFELASLKCFLCDRFVEGDEQPSMIFETKLAAILSAALGCELDEEGTHSSMLCKNCNDIVLEYENLELRFCELRYSILSAYNRTAKRNGFTPIAIEMNGELHQPTELEKEVCEITTETESKSLPYVELIEGYSLLDNFDVLSETAAADLVKKEVKEVKEVYDDDEDDEEVANLQTAVDDLGSYAFSVVNDHEANEFILNEANSELQIDVDSSEETIIYNQLNEQPSEQSPDTNDLIQTSSSNGKNTCDSVDQAAVRFVRSVFASGKPLFSIEGPNNSYLCLICKLLSKNQQNSDFQEQELLPSDSSFQMHMRKVHNTEFYICGLCSNQGFLQRKKLHKHHTEKHGQKYDCDMCSTTFTDHRLFRIHKREHYNKTKNFECSECHKKYASLNLLKEHQNMHTGNRPFVCAKCPKAFASKYSLNAHTKTHAERQKKFQCHICPKAFFNARNLTQHVKLHAAERKHVCEICSKAFVTKHNLDVHKIVHSGQRPFKCRSCDKSFARHAEVKDHERTHTGERPFKCDMCPLAFAQRSNLSSHKKVTHLNEKAHECEYCHRLFKRRRLLEYHINSVHTGERPYKCDVCSSNFVYPEHLKKHLLIHGTEKPYACEVCGKLFHSRDNRNAHRFIHSSKKPYECLECGVGFTRKPLLLAHMKELNHSNDTIIVNQPLISELSKLNASNNNTKELGTQFEMYSNDAEREIMALENSPLTQSEPNVLAESEFNEWQQDVTKESLFMIM